MEKEIISIIKNSEIHLALKILKEQELISNLCFCCKKQITLQNIGGFLPYKNTINVFCDNLSCCFNAIKKFRNLNGNSPLLLEDKSKNG